MHRSVVVVGILAACFASPAVAAPVRVAVFDFELIDTSLDGAMSGPKVEEAERLDRIGAQLREAVAGATGFEVADIGPVEASAKAQNLQGCGGCDRGLAQKVGADWSVTGTVQKVSNLILNINVYVKDVGSGQLTQVMSVDIRGNNDESWQRGMSWLIRHRLKLEP